MAAFVATTNGTFYGPTAFGGDENCSCGTVFSPSVGLRPFVSFGRSSAKVGQVAQILGQGFTGATDVSFHGSPATFTIHSDTYLTATVPAGATTGFVFMKEPGSTVQAT